MPKNKFQDVVFTIIMASVMVYGMVAYNIVLNTGSLENWVFGAVFTSGPSWCSLLSHSSSFSSADSP